eukprot:TRINITY_DN5142_c0_g1_i3.p1 TRINITY_DN5142_c0_g1~~TRINITY_DN5142_c0_g1_i3.p1  ORF type:complete len:741 (-),score=235.75 TRINITY_DN5142_c0_g1_i3:178-2400(-)
MGRIRSLLFLTIVLGVSAKLPSDGAASFNVQVNNQTGSFGFFVDGAQWLTSGPVAVHLDGQWFKTDDQSLKLKSFSTSSGTDNFGAYQLSLLLWAAGGTPFSTYFRVYNDIEMIVFGQVFPQGANNTAVGDNSDVISAFPTLQKTSGTPLNYLTFFGCFAYPHLGHFDPASQVPGGASAGAPLVFFDANLRTVVFSPFNNFMVGVQTTSKALNTIAFGLQGLVKQVPNGFVHETVAIGGHSVNSALYTWGSALLTAGGKTRSSVNSDVVIQQLGYWTDNGAYYYYNTESDKNYEQTMVDTKLSLDASGLPVRNWQFDSWWYFKGNHSGVSLWEPRPDVFPDGFDYVQDKIPLPYTLHNRYFANNSTYLADYKFIVEDYCALPLDINLFLHIMGKAKAWGMVVYEQDWLITTYQEMQATQNDVYNAHTWLKAMGDAASQLNLTIQYCMPLPNHLLQSTTIQAVTQSRASNDYNPGNDQWKVGYTGMLLWSLGLMPFKDDFWTTSNQPNCPSSFAQCVEPNPVLQALVATLTAGPVGFSDAIGHTDTELVMRTSRADGLLLKADKPATPVDKVLLQFDFSSEPQLYEAWSSTTTLSGTTWTYVLGADLPTDVTLTPGDLGLPSGGSFVAWDFFANTTAPFDAGHPLVLKAAKQSVPVDFSYYTISPVLSNGWTIIGELSKFITVSPGRVSAAGTITNGVSISILAASKEVTTWGLLNANNVFVSMSCTGSTTITCTSSGCAC